MNNSDTRFIDESLIENGDSKMDLSLSTSCLDIENHLSDPDTRTPIEAVVRISQPDSDSELIKHGSGENNLKEHMWKNVSLQKTV